MPKVRGLLGTGAITALGVLAGCATFGGNVKANFRCEAPGGMCAPTSKIDDQALALISGDQGQRSDAPIPAAGTNGLASSLPAAHSPRALKIVLPARQDRFGRWREPTIVYAELDDDGPVMLTGADRPSAGPPKLSLADLAAGAPELPAAIAAAPEQSGKPASREEITDAVKQRLQAAMAPVSATAAQAATSASVDAHPVSAPSFPAGSAAAAGK